MVKKVEQMRHMTWEEFMKERLTPEEILQVKCMTEDMFSKKVIKIYKKEYAEDKD